ncbi:MAG TPA: hypothetical protein VFB12_24280 [Ktedonobacteraceae bacterium]|nr:hypothetical protein [Ktedonobacteraceae bacterium]
MNLFKQVPAFSRGRYAAHLFTNGLHGEEMGNGRASLATLSPRHAPQAARTHSYDEQERWQ